MVELKQELLADIIDETSALLNQQYLELALNQEVVKLKPMWETYLTLERQHRFFVFTARIDGNLVGYSAFFLDKHIHYEDLLVAKNDVLFLREDIRLGTAGIKLIKFSENKMKEFGAHKIVWHVKFTKDFRPILHRLGYVDEEVIVGKLL